MSGSQLASVRADGSRNAIHPADVSGRFITARRTVFTLLVVFYVALPFLRWGEHPLLHLDVARRHFYLFGATFNAQDAWLLVLCFITVALSLISVTAILGRVWCGWACPQTVFLELLYRPLERLIDGPAEHRRRIASEPRTLRRTARAGLKHLLYLITSAVIAHSVVALFVSMDRLVGMVKDGPSGHWTEFTWTTLITVVLYFNYAWFREQLCVVVCPYGRLQSSMVDRDSMVIGYDVGRGEPRGHLAKNANAATRMGDCIDCSRCVRVCPTGIDIREGLQLECVACAQCIDACDEVMVKIGKPRGLVRYDSLNGLSGNPRKIARPRLLAYLGLLGAAVGGLVLTLSARVPFEANLLRAAAAPYVIDGGMVRNQYELHLINKRSTAATFRIRVVSPVPVQVALPQSELHLESLEGIRMPLFVSIDRARFQGPFEVSLEILQDGSDEPRIARQRFVGPLTAITQ